MSRDRMMTSEHRLVKRMGLPPHVFVLAFILVNSIPHWASAEILPEDPSARDLKFVDGTKRYEKTVYLKDYFLANAYSIDDHRFVASVIASKTFDSRPDNTPKVVIVDTETGEVKDTGYVGDVLCYSEGRIATSNIGVGGPNAASYFGKLGEPLQKISPMESGSRA